MSVEFHSEYAALQMARDFRNLGDSVMDQAFRLEDGAEDGLNTNAVAMIHEFADTHDLEELAARAEEYLADNGLKAVYGRAVAL